MPAYSATGIYDNGKTFLAEININLPNECPSCKGNISPVYLGGWVNADANTMYALFECRKCHSGFIMSASEVEVKSKSYNKVFYLSDNSKIEYAPNRPIPITFSEHISNLSSQFVKIYNQANAAEAAGLDEIAGIGYRKALEFLIKDYLCEGKGDEEKQIIIKKFLGNVIKEDIENSNIKAVAVRAVWLGNDEAHYYRKWEDKDIDDLKVLIKLAVNWIETELITQEYIREMPSGKN